jgi:hypothetical protein
MENFDWDSWLEDSRIYEPVATLWIDKDSDRVELILDTSACVYHEWIKGEGADISLVRCSKTNKVVGINLPLYKTNFSVFHTDGIQVKINEGYKKLFLEKENNNDNSLGRMEHN